jgi:hypothetical protein
MDGGIARPFPGISKLNEPFCPVISVRVATYKANGMCPN